MPQTAWLKQQNTVPHTSGGREVQDQGFGRVWFLVRELFLDLQMAPFFFAISSHGRKAHTDLIALVKPLILLD